ncbi:MAG: hypothetical protein IJ980_00690 [Oscillospiraceae bacterium]|nr:hypothetical protein [Oscillospiraceae bacterium]
MNRDFTVFAHRGASSYAPGNTMLAFYLGVWMRADGIETDVRRTKDGKLVLFHDTTIRKLTGIEDETRLLKDYTYAELCDMPFHSRKSDQIDRIPLFEDFLDKFGWRDLHFAIELKEDGTEDEVLALLEKYDLRKKTTVTSFTFDRIAEIKRLRPDYRVGWLRQDLGEEELAAARSIGAEQVCPRACNVTAEKIRAWHDAGFEVRTWGVLDEALMRLVYDCGADGTTVNFPDLLLAYMKENPR